MKIVANGFGRNVVGYHTLTDNTLDPSAFHVTDDGVEIYVSKSKKTWPERLLSSSRFTDYRRNQAGITFRHYYKARKENR